MKKIGQALKFKIMQAVQSYLGTQQYLMLQIDITNACNLKCTHCYHPHHKNEGALDLKGWFEIFDQYDELLQELCHKPSLIICGGEPFVSPNLEPIIEEMKRRWGRCPVTILTNGTLLRKERLRIFDGVDVKFQVSLDGPDATRHDAKRGKGSFERSKKGISLLKQEGFHVSSLAILSRQTAQWIPEFFKAAEELSLDAMNFTRLIAQGTGAAMVESGTDAPLSPFELKKAYEQIYTISKKSKVETNTDKPLYHLIDPKIGANASFGFQGLVIDYKGNLKVSSRTNYVVGNIKEKGLRELFLSHPLFVSLRDGQIDGCGTCRFYKSCGGDRNAAYAEFGDFLAPDPGCWFLKANELKEVL